MAKPATFRFLSRSTSSTLPRSRLAAAAVLAASVSSGSLAAPVDVNSADAQSLSDALSGVGPAIGQAIVDYRKENGPFENADDLLDVKGIGPSILERNREDILTGGHKEKAAAE